MMGTTPAYSAAQRMPDNVGWIIKGSAVVSFR
jgi:hypothetical protein